MDRQPGGDGPLLAQRLADADDRLDPDLLDSLIDTLLSRADTTAQRIDDIAVLVLRCE
ncbi:hypothetical protein [Streptomyces chartreusis]|uniref:hypothetical protein n=1 Tax=Streptomyces chartreusis TaxID=1969 RepID=UPI00364C1821